MGVDSCFFLGSLSYANEIARPVPPQCVEKEIAVSMKKNPGGEQESATNYRQTDVVEGETIEGDSV